jgi:hypothetical protein
MNKMGFYTSAENVSTSGTFSIFTGGFCEQLVWKPNENGDVLLASLKNCLCKYLHRQLV